MKKLCLFCITLSLSCNLFASHISGGELIYEYLGAGSSPNTDKFKITMRLFRECTSSGQVLNAEIVQIGIYNNPSLDLNQTVYLTKEWTSQDPPSIQNTSGITPCLTNEFDLCYQVGVFSNQVELPRTASGYTLSWIRFSRQKIVNVADIPYPKYAVGATFITTIPGSNQLPSGSNSCPQFGINDTVIVCGNKNFDLSYKAIDVDGDSLVYSFTSPYNGGDSIIPNPSPPTFLRLTPLPFVSPFSGTSPLGVNVTINSSTGMISGIAPAAGKYVVNVSVKEYRNGVYLSEHRKDFILSIGNCDFTSAVLPEKIVQFNTFSAFFENNSTSSNIVKYHWNFGVPSILTDTSNSPTPTYVYADTGSYIVKLNVEGLAGCKDSSTTKILVYPGFKANFGFTPGCYQTPFHFTDSTTSKFGTVKSWYWNFGDINTIADTSIIQNPIYQYPSSGIDTVMLIAASSKGCIDTAYKQLLVLDKPLISLPFRDTLICSGDTLHLTSASSVASNFSWLPNSFISNTSIHDPLVYPPTSTTYIVTVDNQKGCTNSDSIRVNVSNHITLDIGNDTTICQTDIIQLNTTSNALYYSWSPALGLSDSSAQYPLASPLTSTTYHLVASLSNKCFATKDITINVEPYPRVQVGNDTAICFGSSAQLNANISGSNYTWLPTSTLSNASSLTPVANPQSTTTYVLSVTDNKGCTKTVSDSIVVSVIPPVKAFAGNDTSIVFFQPLQLNATGGSIYTWTPTTGMNNPNISNPIVTLDGSIDSITYFVHVATPEGCAADDAVKVFVFKIQPEIFVPSAFTPNGDGRNDIIQPVLSSGMKRLDYFRIYNRWGQLLYSTSEIGKGWDGSIGGKDQAGDSYVYVAQATDYLDRKIFRKGTIVLIR